MNSVTVTQHLCFRGSYVCTKRSWCEVLEPQMEVKVKEKDLASFPVTFISTDVEMLPDLIRSAGFVLLLMMNLFLKKIILMGLNS